MDSICNRNCSYRCSRLGANSRGSVAITQSALGFAIVASLTARSTSPRFLASRHVDLISRTALEVVVCPKTEASKAHR